MADRLGIDHPDSLDLLSFDDREDHVVLSISEDRAWTGSDQEILKLQRKLEFYLTFALKGQLHRLHPEYIGKSVAIEMDCRHAPAPRIAEFVSLARKRMESMGVAFSVSVLQ